MNSKQETNSLFHINDKLKDFFDVKITSPNNRKEQEQLNKNNQLDNLDNNNITNDEIINSLRNKEKPDSVYNFKKDFLVLSFDQTEDQNSLTYKRKVLSNKLMTDITFSLNKAFEFSFQDKIKNNIIVTLSNDKKGLYSLDDSKKEMDDISNIDNNFILNLCSNNIDIKDIFGEPPKMSNRSIKQETFLGLQQINEKNKNLLLEEEILKAKKNYSPEHTVHLVFNYEEDEEFDIECYEFFINFIKKYEDKPLASKVKLVLSYIQEKNPETGKFIYNNKAKNEILHYWKNEYEKAIKMYQEQIEEELLKKKKSESKNKKTKKIKSPYVKKITKINGFDSINSVRKKNLSNLNNNNNMMSNLKNLNNDINISSFSSEKKYSKKKIIKSNK